MYKQKKKLGLFSLAILTFVLATAYKTDYFEIAKQIELFTTIFKEINMNYVDKTSPSKLMQAALKPMLLELDPYTTYLSEQEVESARMKQGGAYVGIGAKVEIKKNKLIVIEVFEGLPADENGVKAGDEIIQIDGNDVSDLKGVAQQLLNGKKNSSVKVLILSNGVEREISVKRTGVKPKAVPFVKLFDDGVGYIALDRFSKTASGEVESALRLLIIDETKGIILDLRNNPGGLLQEAIKIVNLFIPKEQLVVSTKSNVESYNQEFTTTKQPVSLEVPLVVLINKNSASASEIVAGALQDLDRAVVLGKRSFGKGLVQRPLPLPYGSQLKVTISKYFTPSGRCIQATDYKRRGVNGVARKFKKEEYKAYKTKNGRTVYDGGGVSPDIYYDQDKESNFIENLISSDLVFDFANNFSYNNSVKDVKSFKLSDKEFNNFKELSFENAYFSKDKIFSYLNEFSDVLKDEEYEVENELKVLEKGLERSRKKLLVKHREEIKATLEKEIIKRFFYRKGAYNYFTLRDVEVNMARDLLNDTVKYFDIIK